ncbi:MAG: 30S ribosomal protein S20 [Ignavibacteria bacterium]|nr:30S ribosomal protein S20 [Ignavibacteria bacterium]
MANHPSAKKAARQAIKRRAHNRILNTVLKTAIKKVRVAKNKTDGEPIFKESIKVLDKMASKGIIHKNKAANQKSKLSKFVKTLP